jgi:hypothetical protein
MRVSIARLLVALATFPALAAAEEAPRSGGPGEAAPGRAVAKSAYAPTVDPDPVPASRVPLGNLKPGGACGRSGIAFAYSF